LEISIETMIVFLNGQFVPEAQAFVPIFDRGFLYGDGLFETLRVANGNPFRWDDHAARLGRGAALLSLKPPFTAAELRWHAAELIQRNQMPDAVLRLQITRGVGPRGYSIRGANRPTVVMTLHPAPVIDPANPPRWRLTTASRRLPPNDPLACVKTCNKLPYILARAEAEAAGADAALLLNTAGEIAEADCANVFWIEGDTVFTTPLSSGALAGVTRVVVRELCQSLGRVVVEKQVRPEAVRGADAVFLTLSSLGIVEGDCLDQVKLRRCPVVEALRGQYASLVSRETAQPLA
jgi:branched-chain amino acid aminotransferase